MTADQWKELLLGTIPKSTFENQVEGDLDYTEFLNSIAVRAVKLPAESAEPGAFQLVQTDRNRLKLTGSVNVDGRPKNFLAETVWLPAFHTYRGHVYLLEPTPPRPPAKSIGQFISDLEGIRDLDELIMDGHIHDALAGVDTETDPDICRAWPSIFNLFERFPEEDFGCPGQLVHLMEAWGEYEDLLEASVRRKATEHTLWMVHRLLNSSLPENQRQRWLGLLRDVRDDAETLPGLHEQAREILDLQDSM